MANEPKDRWDKFSIITTVIASILLPFVIFVASFCYTMQQKAADDARLKQQKEADDARLKQQKEADQDNRNADRAAQLLTHISSNNPRERCFAIQFAKHLIENNLFPKNLLSEEDFIISGIEDENEEVLHCAAHAVTEVTEKKPEFEQTFKTAAKKIEPRTIERAVNLNPQLKGIFNK